MMISYAKLPQLSPYLLEESYVLDVEARPGSVRFRLDLVLTPEHVAYKTPVPSEQYCFRRALLEFTDVEHLLWTEQGAIPARDATGEIDYGNIDFFEFDETGFRLQGNWGRMEIRASSLKVILEGTG